MTTVPCVRRRSHENTFMLKGQHYICNTSLHTLAAKFVACTTQGVGHDSPTVVCVAERVNTKILYAILL